jgi:hypothetical protein
MSDCVARRPTETDESCCRFATTGMKNVLHMILLGVFFSAHVILLGVFFSAHVILLGVFFSAQRNREKLVGNFRASNFRAWNVDCH